MAISVKKTNDGSATLYHAELNEHYHSIHGALTESQHVFIQNGLIPALNTNKEAFRILEIGLGTGLNAALTAYEASIRKVPITYIGLEPFPIEGQLIEALNYKEKLSEQQVVFFEKIHAVEWEKDVSIHAQFTLKKQKKPIQDYSSNEAIDLIYFDAFAPEKQPEMWEISVLETCYNLLSTGGIFITYCAQGQFKRNLKACGFKVEARPGPPFKREITFAYK